MKLAAIVQDPATADKTTQVGVLVPPGAQPPINCVAPACTIVPSYNDDRDEALVRSLLDPVIPSLALALLMAVCALSCGVTVALAAVRLTKRLRVHFYHD
jgi:ABC-type Fe3+ transport system permease subunit